MKLNKFITIVLGIMLIMCQGYLTAQEVPSDLSKVKAEQLTDEQVKKLVERAEASGMSMQQMESAALARGMSPAELQKLRQRIQQLGREDSNGDISRRRSREYSGEKLIEDPGIFETLVRDAEADTVEQFTEKQKKIFGYTLFANQFLSFEPSMNIPTPEDYQLGAGDEIIIDVWGASRQNYQKEITPDGFILLENIGPIYLNGLTIEKATSKIKGRLKSIYSGLGSNTFAQVSVGGVRSIKVNIIGEVNVPGTYTLPSFATAFNALYACGGPNENGTFREIKIIRNDKVFSVLDVYDFLVKGIQKNNIRLNDQDIIMVGTYGTRVEIEGEVKRPGIFEMKEGETLEDLLAFSGSFTGKAYTGRLRVYRNTPSQRRILDVNNDQFGGFQLTNGDFLSVEPILARFENRVEINGAVYREGEYELTPGLTLKKLISKAGGLRGDAFLSRISIYRMQDNFRIEVLPVDLEVLMNSPADDIPLQREDYIKIASIFDLEENFTIKVKGEVQFPGDYSYAENISLEEILIKAGGLLESASLSKIEIARRHKDKTALEPADNIAEIYQFSITDDLRLIDTAMGFQLQPYDIVFVRKSPGYEEQKIVSIEGEVLFPGEYTISGKDERISDIIQRAGGLTPEAYVPGARLTRTFVIDEKERLKTLKQLQSQSEDTIAIDLDVDRQQAIGIDLREILSDPKGERDLILEDRDRIEVPKQLQTVRLTGAVLYPVTVQYKKMGSLRRYVAGAGGFAENAKRSKAYVIYANGSVDKTRNYFLFKDYPRVEPGAEIVVPEKPEREKLSTQEALGISSTITSIALVVVTIINQL